MNQKSDFKNITELLDPEELQQFCFELPGLSHADVKKAECNANSNHPELKARGVLHLWHQRNGRRAIRQAILQALGRCGYMHAVEQLREKWDLTGKYILNILYISSTRIRHKKCCFNCN